MFEKYLNSYLVVILCIIITNCSTPQRPVKIYKATITGIGSSFSLPLSSLLFKKFTKESNINISYTTENSYTGIDAIINQEVDFALSIASLTDQQVKENPDILHIPIAAASINFAYNIPGKGFSIFDDPVYLTPELLVQILNKEIIKWNDPKIIALNTKFSTDKTRVFPDLSITFIQRSTNSADTALFTKFLTKATPTWKQGNINKFKMIGNTLERLTSLEMMQLLSQTPGALTYTTMIYGTQNNIPLIRINNYLGTYGRGCNFRTLESMKVAETNNDNRVDLTYPHKGKEAAVATGFVYIIVKKEQNYNNRTKEQAQVTVNFINWLLSPSAQKELEPIFFATLTPKFRNAAKKKLTELTYNKEPLIAETILKK
ncbi:MAG: substrate-binding domain-containing protein [Spirochaetota bacterium]|nr:substrate-binding domain-containing protein [Spirochaetota bacterium]